MPRGRVIRAWASGTKVLMQFRPLSGSVQGAVNCPAPENLVLSLNNGRPVKSDLVASVVAGKLVGKEFDMPLFGQMSKEQRKRRLKRKDLWMNRTDRFCLKWRGKAYDIAKGEIEPNFAVMLAAFESVGCIDNVESLDKEAKTVYFYRTKGVGVGELAKAVLALEGFVVDVQSLKPEEPRA